MKMYEVIETTCLTVHKGSQVLVSDIQYELAKRSLRELKDFEKKKVKK